MAEKICRDCHSVWRWIPGVLSTSTEPPFECGHCGCKEFLNFNRPPKSGPKAKAMSSSQPIYCMACGKSYKTNFMLFRGLVCSWRCWDELNWRETLSNLGKEYYPIPEEAQVNKANYDKDVVSAPLE